MFPIIDWGKLLKAQTELDTYVFKAKRVNYSNTSEKRVIALLVELHELANETRAFKFWSARRTGDREKIIEEYADVLHFILSLFLERNETPEGVNVRVKAEQQDPEFLSHEFTKLALAFPNAINLHLYPENITGVKEEDKKDMVNKLLKDWVQSFVDLSGYLGFEWSQVEEAYWRKWQINIDRQNSGSY